MLRHFLITLSHNPQMQDWIVAIPISRQVARRFVAGEVLSSAISVVRALNERGIAATLDHLGENVTNAAEARTAVADYNDALNAIATTGIRSGISIKLTQLGLDISDDLCYDNVCQVLEKAAEHNRFVRIDMEGSDYTERTLQIYRKLRQRYDNVGIVIQAYLYRSESDVRSLIEEGIADIRLCKGAYDEPPHIAYPDKADVDRNFINLTRAMFEHTGKDQGVRLAVASHDERIIDYARAYVYHHQIPPDAFEFQMLYGIRRERQQQLADEGYGVRIYVPYGSAWYPYFMRRLAERPANLLFFLQALVGD
ncbi:MAG TPA: proline dehydrogenase [Anaerolineae bacterium]|nr:proline dehydrogenase [Anaerolineae bacterium]